MPKRNLDKVFDDYIQREYVVDISSTDEEIDDHLDEYLDELRDLDELEKGDLINVIKG